MFDGKAIIAENGTVLASNPRWTPSENVSIADLDIEALRRDRMHMTTFADCAAREGASEIEVVPAPEGKEYAFSPEEKLMRRIDPRPFVPADLDDRADRCDEIFNIQAAGLAKRLYAINCKTLVVGISGGLDSTIALLVAVKAFDRLGFPARASSASPCPDSEPHRAPTTTPSTSCASSASPPWRYLSAPPSSSTSRT